MAKTQADYMRAYRQRKREGLTRHACPACHHMHYPVSNSLGEDLTREVLTPPDSEPLTREELTHAEPCPESARWHAAAQTAVDRGKDYLAESKALRADLATAQHMVRAMQGYLDDCRAAMGTSAWARLDAKWEAEA